MIEMKNVYKKYPNGITAINGLDVTIEQGDFVYVVGPSGAGKSTFIKIDLPRRTSDKRNSKSR